MTDNNVVDGDKRQPLMNKLEPSHIKHSNAFHHETVEWSKTGRDLVQFIMDGIKWLLG